MKIKVGEKIFRGQQYSSSANFREGVSLPDEITNLIEAYKIHPWVYAGIYAIANAVASVDFKIFKVSAKGELAPDTQHPYNIIFNRPNPIMTFYDLKERSTILLETMGNAYWGLERNGKKIVEAWSLDPEKIRVKPSAEELISSYIYVENNKQIPYALEDIIHVKYSSPDDLIFGQGSIQAAKKAIITDLFAETWNQAFFRNSARPDAVLETDGALQPGDRKRIMDAFMRLHGGAKQNRKVALLERGTKFKPLDYKHSEMEFIELRKQAIQIVLSVLGVPPSIVGILEYANYSNIKEQNQMFWKYTIVPKIRKFESTLTLKAQAEVKSDKVVVAGDLSKVEALRVDEEQRSKVVRAYWDMGVPFNKLIETFDLPFDPKDIPNGDEPKPQNLIPDPTSPTPTPTTGRALKQKTIVQKDELTTVWKKFDRKVSKYEDKMEVKMSAFFKGQRRRVIAKFQESADAILNNKGINTSPEDVVTFIKASDTVILDMIFDNEREEAGLKRAAGKVIKGTYFDFAVDMSKKINPEFDFNLKDPRALAWIDAKTFKISREANNTTKEQLTEGIVDAIEDAIAEGVDKSETIAQVVDRINDVYEFAAKSRAQTIARTEVIGAANAGTHEGMKATGVTEKRWLDTKDDKTRDTHAALGDNAAIPIDEPFVTDTGAKLMFPGDQDSNAPEEVINCRCTLLAVTKES